MENNYKNGFIAHYVKKPISINAIQWTGDNLKQVDSFIHNVPASEIAQDTEYQEKIKQEGLIIHTLEGDMRAEIGDYIIQGVEGEFYPCKPNIFEKTYSIVEERPLPSIEYVKDQLKEKGYKELMYAVYSSSEKTIMVQDDPIYSGAHNYVAFNSYGYREGRVGYTSEYHTIDFVQKTDETTNPGLQSEQLAYILLDRVKKLNEVYPSKFNDQQIEGLEIYLNACANRIQDRIDRGVMGELKK